MKSMSSLRVCCALLCLCLMCLDSFRVISPLRLSHTDVSLNALRNPGTKRNKQMKNILQSLVDERNPKLPDIALSEDPILPMVEAAVRAADKRKAPYINSFRVTHLTEVTQFMLVIEGNSKPQNMAISLSIEDDLLQEFSATPDKQGEAASGWIILDYGSLIVHVMTPQMRNFYKLEKRWKNAEVSFILHFFPTELSLAEYVCACRVCSLWI